MISILQKKKLFIKNENERIFNTLLFLKMFTMNICTHMYIYTYTVCVCVCILFTVNMKYI